jgi:hypothetical protein
MTSLPSPDTAAIAPQSTLRLQELATSLRSRSQRMGRDIYWQGCDLLEAKELFGRGQNQAFLDWARDYAKIRTTLVYRFMQVAKAFPEFKEEDFEVIATALYEFASPSTPQSARLEFLDRSRSGEIIALPEAEAIIQRYRGTEDKQLEQYQALVRAWGTLERLEGESDGLRLQLPDGKVQHFRNYTALKEAYTNWRRTVFAADLQTIRDLVSPDWQIRPCPVRNKPFQLEVACQIPGRNKTFIIDTPRTFIEWWYHRGQSLTQTLKQAFSTDERSLQSLETKDFPKPSCLTCGWCEPDSQAASPTEFWCGYYRTAFAREHQHERPAICRKWHPATAQEALKDRLDVYPTEVMVDQDVTSSIQKQIAPDRSLTTETNKLEIDQIAFEAVLHLVPKLSSEQLMSLESAIRAAKRSQTSIFKN